MFDSEWTKKGGTLSDKSARKEFGLKQEEIIDAIRSGKLQYRQNYMHGNRYFRLIRSEVEAFVYAECGSNYLKNKKLKNELTQVNKELKRLKAEFARLEQRKVELLKEIGE